MITRERVKDSTKLTATEKMILDKMLEWEGWRQDRGCADDTFIIANEAVLIEMGASDLFTAFGHLVDMGILKKRNCDAVAYEWDNRALLENYL